VKRCAGDGAEAVVEALFEGLSLLARETVDRGVAADELVVLTDRLGPLARDEAAEPVPGRLRHGDVDDGRVHEQVVEERLYVLLRHRPAEVHHHHADAIPRLYLHRLLGEIPSRDETLVVPIDL
jgi:hypothetical protein